MQKNKSDLDKATTVLTLGALATVGAVKGYKELRFRMGRQREEYIKVAKICKGPHLRSPRLKLSNTSLFKIDLLNLPLFTEENFILTNDKGEDFIIGAGNLHLKNSMEVGKTYKCRVLGDRAWGVPKIVCSLGEVEEEEVHLGEAEETETTEK